MYKVQLPPPPLTLQQVSSNSSPVDTKIRSSCSTSTLYPQTELLGLVQVSYGGTTGLLWLYSLDCFWWTTWRGHSLMACYHRTTKSCGYTTILTMTVCWVLKNKPWFTSDLKHFSIKRTKPWVWSLLQEEAKSYTGAEEHERCLEWYEENHWVLKDKQPVGSLERLHEVNYFFSSFSSQTSAATTIHPLFPHTSNNLQT